MNRRSPGPAAGKPLLFWDDQAGELQPLLDLLGVVPGGRKHGQPKDHVRQDVPWEDREELTRALQFRTTMNPTGGDVLMGYMGWADCRICGERLGTRDFFGHGFVWPEKAEHYVIAHHVWTPECENYSPPCGARDEGPRDHETDDSPGSRRPGWCQERPTPLHPRLVRRGSPPDRRGRL